MNKTSNLNRNISTTTVEEGLDFACNLMSGPLSVEGERSPEKAYELLRILTQYIEFRYAGELGLALEYLTDLGQEISSPTPTIVQQFWPQLRWLAEKMNLSTDEIDKKIENLK